MRNIPQFPKAAGPWDTIEVRPDSTAGAGRPCSPEGQYSSDESGAPQPPAAERLRETLAARLVRATGTDPAAAGDREWLHTLALETRDRLIERWLDTRRTHDARHTKRVHYLSMEFLIGRTLLNSLHSLEIDDTARQALAMLGLDLERLREAEPDAGLGNGGLGRLAACFLDSMAALGLAGSGYGLRYDYGMFRQAIVDGRQTELPDDWLRHGNPWELRRPEADCVVQFYGSVERRRDADGRERFAWIGTEDVAALAHDTPVPGHDGATVNHLRLWSARAVNEFDLASFNAGEHERAVATRARAEALTRVLYPADQTDSGRALRLRQEYFFVSASMQDILREHLRHYPLTALPDQAAIQLNDTHPALAIPELMRLLLDVHDLEWEAAWAITRSVFAYTNHTLMPEALETWRLDLFEALLPRHFQLICEINRRLLAEVQRQFPDEPELLPRMSLIDESGGSVRMAYLAVAGSHRVNGVARIHSGLMRETIFRDFARLDPQQFVNITNGITPRLWLGQANPALADLIDRWIGPAWRTDLERLADLTPLADDADFRQAFAAVKQDNKRRLAALAGEQQGITIAPDSLFDMQIKRIHEYKRQLLNVLHVITLHERIRAGEATVPRTVFFSGKAAPGYAMAKLIIRLIHDVAATVNADPAADGRLKVVFMPNYDVSTALRMIPAADLSEQISTAGTEASGTGNMKMALNGALTIGTLDGANVEMCDRIGEDNMFIFGLHADEAQTLRQEGYAPETIYRSWPRVRCAVDRLMTGFFSPQEPDRYQPIVDSLLTQDQYLLLADFSAYVDCQEQVAELWLQPDEWTRRAVLNVAGMGNFSSDRAIREYARTIWGVPPAR